MPEVPRDPRQLARDILSGKVTIEQLAREQQRQRAAQGGANVPPLQVRPPIPPPAQARVPLPRPAAPMPGQRPVMRPPPPPPRPMQRPAQGVPQQRRQIPAPPPAQRQPPRGPQIQRQAAPQQLTRPATSGSAGQQPVTGAYAAPQGIQDARMPTALGRGVTVRSFTKNRALLRQAIVMSEVLGKPLALRDDF
jgi:hypothetical protein